MRKETAAIARARSAYLAIPRARWKADNGPKDAARQKWSDACLGPIEKVKTVDEAIAAFKAAPWGSPAKQLALEKWAEVCTTFVELKHAFDVSRTRFQYNNAALLKWNAMSYAQVDAATTLEEIALAFRNAPRAKELDYCDEMGDQLFEKMAAARAVGKMVDRCNTLDELYALRKVRHILEDLDAWPAYRAKAHALYVKEYGHPPEYPIALTPFDGMVETMNLLSG